MRDTGNLALAGVVDLIRGDRGVQESHAMFRGINTAVRVVEAGQRIGENREVFDAPGSDAQAGDLAEERALTARLEELREARAARERKGA